MSRVSPQPQPPSRQASGHLKTGSSNNKLVRNPSMGADKVKRVQNGESSAQNTPPKYAQYAIEKVNSKDPRKSEKTDSGLHRKQNKSPTGSPEPSTKLQGKHMNTKAFHKYTENNSSQMIVVSRGSSFGDDMKNREDECDAVTRMRNKRLRDQQNLASKRKGKMKRFKGQRRPLSERVLNFFGYTPQKVYLTCPKAVEAVNALRMHPKLLKRLKARFDCIDIGEG